MELKTLKRKLYEFDYTYVVLDIKSKEFKEKNSQRNSLITECRKLDKQTRDKEIKPIFHKMCGPKRGMNFYSCI